jgi:23S rRNA (pseudouridine1915-N3)-methyltransferase
MEYALPGPPTLSSWRSVSHDTRFYGCGFRCLNREAVENGTKYMKITLAAISSRRTRSKASGLDALVADYIHRCTRYEPTEAAFFDTEAALLASADRAPGRVAAHLILLDSRGQLLTSEDLARHLGKQRDEGTQRLILAIGPADGWSDATRARGHLLVSLGRITLPHELARAVLAEQTYRALTILAGHPYHCGH